MKRTTATAIGCAALLLAGVGFSAVAQMPDRPAMDTMRGQMQRPDRAAMQAMMKTDAELVARLEAEGFTDVRVTDSERHKIEVEAKDADGRRIEVEMGRRGIVIEFEVRDDTPAVDADLMRLMPQPVRDAAVSAGIVDVREYDRSRRGVEIEGYDATGREVEVQLDAEARMRPQGRAERGRDGDRREGRGPRMDLAGVRAAVVQAGYTLRGDVEFRRAHAAVIAANPEGEVVELHIEPDGAIVREQRRLDLD